MKPVPNLPVDVLVGGELAGIACRPLAPYSAEAVGLLAALSKRLLALPELRSYPDIAGFAYWCRPANLARLAREFDGPQRRIGRGIVLHIAPANVPVNFAFSLAFGLLAGNANIVRIPEARHPQALIICRELAALLELPEHARISTMTRIIGYPRDDAMTAALSEACHARVLWGGDGTVGHLRAMRTAPRCVDICFADRYSLCVLGAGAILAASEAALAALVAGFYSDVFLFDQNACSSPHLVLWQGSEAEIEQAMARFWPAMTAHLRSKQPAPAIHAVEKYLQLCRSAIALEEHAGEILQQDVIYRIRLDTVPRDIDQHHGQYGFFFEATDNELAQLASIANERYQTVTCFGVEPKTIIDAVLASGLTGIDRVVPVGSALDIGVVWDGFDLVGSLSRIIAEH